MCGREHSAAWRPGSRLAQLLVWLRGARDRGQAWARGTRPPAAHARAAARPSAQPARHTPAPPPRRRTAGVAKDVHGHHGLWAALSSNVLITRFDIRTRYIHDLTLDVYAQVGGESERAGEARGLCGASCSVKHAGSRLTLLLAQAAAASNTAATQPLAFANPVCAAPPCAAPCRSA